MSTPTRMCALASSALASLTLAAAVTTATASGAEGRVQHFRDTSPVETFVYEPCGAVETRTVTVHGADYFDAGGQLVRSLLHFFYDSTVTGPAGRSISFDGHQNVELTADGILTLSGQGANVRAPGLGVLYQDVGRLVVDVTVPFPGETLFASAKAVTFEAFDPDRLAAAVCQAVG